MVNSAEEKDNGGQENMGRRVQTVKDIIDLVFKIESLKPTQREVIAATIEALTKAKD